MAPSTEQIDDLLDWRPGPSRAAAVNIVAALRWGMRRAWASKLLIGYLWLFHFLVVERVGPLLLQALRSSSPLAHQAMSAFESTAAASAFAAPATEDGYRRIVMASLERPTWSAEAHFVLFYAFLAGGVVAYLHAPRPAPLLPQLGANCGNYLGRFLRLLLIAAGAMWLFGGAAGLLLSSGTVGDMVWPRIIALQVTITGLAMVLDYARVRTVARDSRSMLLETYRSIRFVIRNLPRTLGLQFLLLALGGLVGGLVLALASVLHALLPPTATVVVAEQLYVAGTLWVRLVMWGAMLSLYQGITSQQLAARSGA